MAKKKTVLENLRRLDEDREKEAEKQEEKKENRVIVNSYSPSSSSLSGAVNTKADQTKERERIILPTSSSSVLPTGSSNIARAQSRVSTPPQNDAGFLEYSIRNRNYQRPETQSGADYNALHEAWAKKTAAQQAIEETKKNGSNVTWNQALGRAANRAAQAAVTGVGNLGTAVRSTFGLPEYKSHQPVLDYLQNTEAGRQNAELSRLNAQSAEAENAYNTAMAASTARRAMSSGDFSAYSRYDPNKGNDKEFDKTYETVNRSRRYQTEALSQAMGANRGIDPNLAQLTSEEQAVYNYLYNKGDKASADNYLKSLYSELEKRGYTARETNLKEYAAENPVAASIVSPMLGSVSGIAAIPGTIETLRTGRVNPYASYNSVSQTGQTLRNTVAEKIAEPGTFSAKAASWIYQVGESVLENFLRTKMFGGLGANIGAAAGFDTEGIKSAAKVASLSPMLLSVFQSTANNAKLNGRTDEEAKTLAAIAAGAEWITESKSFEHLFDTYVKALEGKGSIGDWLGQISTEALEEGGSNIINNVADVMILGDQSEWARLVKKYQEEDHLSAADAKKKAFIAKAIDLGLDALGGAISGGALGGDALLAGVTKASVNAAAKSQENTKTNRLMKAQNKIEESMQKKAQVEAEVKASQGQTAEQWEQSRRDQSEGAKKRRAVIRDTGTKYNVAEDTIRSLEAVSDVTGADITILDAQGMKDRFNVKAEGNQIIPGFRVTKTGEIVINSETDTDTAIKEVLGHELAHSLEGNKLWNDLRDAAWEYYSALADEETVSREKEDFKARLEGKKTADFDFDSELTADFAGNVLLDSTSDIEKLVNSRHGLAQQIWNKLNEWLTRNTDDLDLRTKALLTSAREKYGRALQQNAAAAASANTIAPTTNTTVSTTNTTAPTTQAAAPARGTLPTAAENMAAKEMTPYQQAVAELDRRMQAGEFEDDPDEYVEERDRLREEYGISPEDEIHEERQRLGLEDENGEIKYKVVSTTDGREAAIIEDDILDGVPREEWGKTVEKYLINRFRNTGFDIGNLHVQVFPKGTGEYTRNRRTSMMYNNNSPYLKPKFQAAANIDEIGNVGRYWYNEPLTHPRKDDITEFRKAYSLFMIGDKKLGGIFVLAHKKDNTWMLYDLNSIRPEYFNIKKSELSVNREAANLQEKRSFTEGNSDTNNIPQTSPEINNENNNNSKQSVTAEDHETVNEGGAEIDEESKSAYQFSVKTWKRSDYVTKREEMSHVLAKSVLGEDNDENVEIAKKWIDDVNSIAAIITKDSERLDYIASEGRSSFKSNAEYGGSIDFSTICAKRRLLTGTIDAIQNALPDAVLEAEDYLAIRNMMKNDGYEVSCGLCYVESSRKNIAKYANQFLQQWNDSHPDNKLTMVDVNTVLGLENTRLNNSDAYDAYVSFMNKLAQRKPKLFEMRAEYDSEILDKFKDDGTVEDKNKNGGLRINSFSDFEIVHLIDMMQVITDMSAVGLNGQAYTKVPQFAEALGGTGLKINLSMICKGLDENGHIIFDEIEGMKWADAERLRNEYPDNVGTILVTFTDEQLKAALNDPRVDFIIPFHRSQWSRSDYAAIGIPTNAKDATLQQNERYIKPVTRINKNGKEVKVNPENYMPNEYWDFDLSGKENAEKYLQMCADNNRRPKFYKLLVNNGDGSYSLQPDGSTDGYWKLLIDFKMYNHLTGEGAPQNPVRPEFNMEASQRMLNDYKGGHQSFPVANDIVDRFVDEYGNRGKAKLSGGKYTLNPDLQFKVTSKPLDNASGSEYNTLEADSRVLWGNEGQTRTSDLSPVSFRYAVVPADSLIISNDEYGNVNPDYPAELQPRDRARITSQADIQKMANGIIPDVLADSPYVNNGAPIIRGDGVVVGGNGRVAALRLAESTGKSGEYEDYIRQNAARFGIEGELPENPILVRVADTDDWRELARKSNESTNAAMSSTEQALADADALDADILSMLAVDDEGELNTPKNRDFIAAFVNQVAGDSERGSLVDADGYLLQQGLRRVQAAVFAKAYKDTGMLARMSESLDDDMKNVTKALMGAASRAAVFSENVASGDAYDIDVTNEILAGIEIFEQAKKDGTDIDDIAGQMSLEGQKYGDAARAVAQFINTNKRSGAKISEFLSAIYDKVLSLGSPNQISLDIFGGTENKNVTVNEIFRSAARQLIDEAGYDLAGKPRINLGFEIESIGEQTSLPRNVRESEAESFNGNGDNTVRDVRQPESGRGRAPAQRGGRVTLPAAAEAPDSGRYIDRQSKDFNDIVRQEAAKLGMVTPPEGQLELDDEKERRRAIDNAAQTTREWAGRQVESINAQRLAAQAQTESERQKILAEANEQGEARRRLGNKVAEETVSRAEEEADLYRQGARAEVSQWVEESQNAADNLYEARQRAKEAASERKNNADISVPKTDDAAGQKKMFSDNYNARRAYTLAKATARLSDADWERVADLMRGRLSPEYDIGDAEDPSGVQKVFYAMLDYDRTSRTVEAYRTQKNGELRRQADRLLTNVSAFRDKKTGFQYSRETQERNIRDIAPKEDAEAIVAEMFRPVHHNTRLANDLIRKYTDRMKALNISQKTKDGNKVSEAYAIQLVGEMNAIINELSSANDRFQKTLQRKMDIYDSGMGTNGLTRQEADAMENMSRKQFHDYLMEKEPRKNGMSFSEASQALDEFMAANKNFDYGEINRKAKEIQKIYQELLPMLNETYMRWGYEPMGEIKGYFPHFLTSGDDLLRRLGKKLGVDQSAIGLPTEIAGQTQDFKPGVRWLANKLQRKSNITDYDVIEGFERYIRSAADVIYHTEDIQKLRQFANQIRYLSSDKGIQEQAKRIEQDGRLDPEAKNAALDSLYENARFALNNYVQNIDEYTNLLAGKRSRLDRGIESQFGRVWLYGVAKALQGLRARSMVQGNITSALTNFIPIAQVSGLAGVRNTSRAFVDTLRNLTGKDGMRDMSDFLTNRRNIDPINLTKGQKIGKAAGALFELCDHIGSETAWRACYYRNLNSGMSKAAAAQLADEQAAGVVADRSKGALPTLFSAQNPIVKWATRFQLEQNNTLSYYFKDLPKEKKEKALIGILISALASWLFNEGYEYLFGRRPAQEPLNLINELAGDLTGYELPNIYKLGEKMITEKRLPTAQDFETKQGDALKNAAVNAFDQMPFIDALNLVSKKLFGVELDGGRYGTTKYFPERERINAVMKDSDNTRDKAQVLVEELSAPVTNYLPGGNQIQKTVKGAATLAAGGSYKIKVNDKGEVERLLQYPVEKTPRNIATALIAGKSALPAAQEWIANDFNTFSAKDTAAIEGLQLMGVSMKDAVSLVDSVRNSGKSTADKLRALRDSDVSPEAKMLYYQSSLANDETTAMLDKYDGSADTGTLLNTLIDIQQCTRDADRSAVLERADLPDDLKEQMYTDLISSAKTRAKELQAVKDSGGTVNDFLSQKAENSTVNFDDGGKLTLPTAGEEQESQTSKTAKSLTGAGVSESGAEKIASAVDALDNPDNITQWKAVTSSGASEKDQLAAMEKYTSEDFYKKLTTASGQGVTVKKYVDWIDKRQDYDADGNGRYTMQEAADGLAAQRDMTKAEKAVLWQLTNNSWNPSKNPFDAGIGQAVYDVMHGAAASAPPSNGVLPAVQGNNALSQALSARSGG